MHCMISVVEAVVDVLLSVFSEANCKSRIDWTIHFLSANERRRCFGAQNQEEP